MTLNNAIKVFGEESQIKKSIEELGELIVELAHHLDSRNNISQVCEEIADVSIMIRQLKIIFPAKIIEGYEEEKLKRLDLRIKKAKEERKYDFISNSSWY